MKITKQQLKEQIRKIIREYLNSEQIFRSHDKRHGTKDFNEEEPDDEVTFFNTSGEPASDKLKKRQKDLADLWQSDQNNK